MPACNDRLAATLHATALTVEALADAVPVTPKTVRRWLADDTVVPHPETRTRVANLLGVPIEEIWRRGADESGSRAELATLYPARSAVPPSLIGSLMAGATSRIDILAFSVLYLWETVDGLLTTLTDRAITGVAVRILLADPNGDAVAARGGEQGLGELARARVQIAWSLLRPLVGVPGIEMGMHDSALHATLLRADDDLLVNQHVFGLPAADAPVMHLRRQEGGRLVDTYLNSLERVAGLARIAGIEPIPTGQSRRISRPRALRPVSQTGGA
jgi:transcriptional regulator with XRE-family HTH domain